MKINGTQTTVMIPSMSFRSVSPRRTYVGLANTYEEPSEALHASSTIEMTDSVCNCTIYIGQHSIWNSNTLVSY